MTRAPSAPDKPRRDSAATQKRLLDAAENEFAVRGFAGARLRDIAAAASVQVTLIHHYFEDKRGLYRAVVERALLPTQEASWSLIREHHDLEPLARGFVRMLTSYYVKHKNVLAIARHELVAGSDVLREILRERLSPVASAAIDALRDMQRKGSIRDDIEPSDIVVMAISMAAYPFVEAPLIDAVVPGAVPGDDRSLSRREDAIVLLLLRALRPDPAAHPPRSAAPLDPAD
ncbi:MAG: helix-turn-helix domain-containing protein [Polyangiaceae bacterium]